MMIGIAQNDVIAIHATLSRYVSDINYTHNAYCISIGLNYRLNNLTHE